MGDLDRGIRGIVGIWLLALAVSALLDDRDRTAATAAIAGVGLIGNAISGTCGGNTLLDIDTRSDEPCSIK